MHVTQYYGNQRNTYEIAGVVRDSRAHRLRGEVEDRFYAPVAQPVNVPATLTFEIRTAAEPQTMLESVRRGH